MNDDCETSAAFAMGEQKTAACVKSVMLNEGIINDGDTGGHKNRNQEFQMKLGELLQNLEADHKKPEFKLIRSLMGSTLKKEDVYTFMAVANILRQFDTGMDLCIGTANAAAVGAAAQLSGHCYAICMGKHHPTQTEVEMIVEGTRWVAQEKYKKKEDRTMSVEVANMLNESASILMEMTKLPERDILTDAGSALMQVVRTNKGGFYANMYVCGDSINIIRGPGKQVTIGASVCTVLGANDAKVDKIRVQYNLVCREIEQRFGTRIQPSAVGKAIRDMARETIVPPW